MLSLKIATAAYVLSNVAGMQVEDALAYYNSNAESRVAGFACVEEAREAVAALCEKILEAAPGAKIISAFA